MKLVVQRVSFASVSVKGKIVDEIGKGLFVLLGVGKNDSRAQADKLVDKLGKLRVMADYEDKMNKTVADVGGQFLVVSQFTLYADTSGGNRPSFLNAAVPDLARELYNYFVEKLRKSGVTVATGSFGDYMKIETELDGPVTLNLEENGQD